LKKRILLAFIMVIMFSMSTCFVLAGKPPKTALDVTISSPEDGRKVKYDGTCGNFEVTGTVLAKRGDAGLVQTFVQYAQGEGSTDFNNVGDSTLQLVNGDQPQEYILSIDQSYEVSWTLTGIPGTYEIRIYSQGETAKSGESESRTVTLLGPPPEPPPDPPTDCEAIDWEYVDPENAFGTASGSFVDTYYEDGVYEVLMEEPNSHGTKNPTDDTADLNWIYEFNGLDPERSDTTFQFVGHMELSGEYLDSGFLEWDDQDTAFYVQVKLSGSWKTIAAITNIGTDRMYSVDVPDDSSLTISLRIVDNDRGPEGKSPQISSLYVDMACIVFEPALEYFIGESPFDIPTGHDGLRIDDVDNDGRNEVYFTYQTDESGFIKYYEYNNGIWTEETLTGPNVFGWVQFENLVGDIQNEILTMELFPNDEFWLGYYKYDSEWIYYPLGQLVTILHTVVVGNIDDDPENEVVACKAPCDGYELKYFDYDSMSDTWIEVPLRNFEYDYSLIEVADIDHDDYNEIVCFARGDISLVGESALKYFELDGTWLEHDILNVESGECMTTGDVDNDGEIEIALGQYQYPERENYVKVYDYDKERKLWEETLDAYLTETLGPIQAVTIGDVDNNDLDANELAIGLFDDGAGLTNMTIRYFEYDAFSGEWTLYNVTDTDMTVAVFQIGDVDNDHDNEILVGLTTWYDDSVVAPELRYYKV
jgi:hypothetical protein